MSEQERKDAARLLELIFGGSEIQDMEEADYLIVKCKDPEDGSESFYGPFDKANPAEALAWAEKFAADVNQGNSENEISFVTSVHHMSEPEVMG